MEKKSWYRWHANLILHDQTCKYDLVGEELAPSLATDFKANCVDDVILYFFGNRL